MKPSIESDKIYFCLSERYCIQAVKFDNELYQKMRLSILEFIGTLHPNDKPWNTILNIFLDKQKNRRFFL